MNSLLTNVRTFERDTVKARYSGVNLQGRNFKHFTSLIHYGPDTSGRTCSNIIYHEAKVLSCRGISCGNNMFFSLNGVNEKFRRTNDNIRSAKVGGLVSLSRG